MKITLPKYSLGTLAIAGMLALWFTPRLRADDDCQKRVTHADHEMHEAAEHHGWDSPEARRAREHLQAARNWCWEHEHKWWDEDAHSWRTEHWDEHDHDHAPH